MYINQILEYVKLFKIKEHSLLMFSREVNHKLWIKP